MPADPADSDRETWEDLLPDEDGPGTSLVENATRAVRFAISGLYDLPAHATNPKTGQPTDLYLLAYIPEPQMRTIQQAPREALALARDIHRQFTAAYYNRCEYWTRQKARGELFRRLGRIVTAADGEAL